MPGTTNEQIQQWRTRWDNFPDMTDKVVAALKCNAPARTAEDAVTRMNDVHDLLKGANRNRSGFEFITDKGEVSILSKQVQVPILDLRGIYLSYRQIDRIIIPRAHLEGANLMWAHLEGANLMWAYLKGADSNNVNLEGADLFRACLEGADLWGAYLKEADLRWAHLEGANLFIAYLNGANLMLAHLEGANLNEAHMEGTNLWGAHLEGAVFKDADLTKANIINVDWRPAKGRPFIPNAADRHFISTRIEGADFAGSRTLERYIRDTQWLAEILDRTDKPFWLKAIHFIWGWSSDYGRSFGRLAFWSLMLIILFAGLYCVGRIPSPHWLPSWLTCDQPWFQFREEIAPNRPFWESLWFSFDIFASLGVRRVFPVNIPAYLLVFAETVLGFIALAALISIMLDKFARRS